MNAPITVRATRGDVDFTNQPCQPLATQLGWCCWCSFSFVIVLPSNPKDSTRTINGHPDVNQTVNSPKHCVQGGAPSG